MVRPNCLRSAQFCGFFVSNTRTVNFTVASNLLPAHLRPLCICCIMPKRVASLIELGAIAVVDSLFPFTSHLVFTSNLGFRVPLQHSLPSRWFASLNFGRGLCHPVCKHCNPSRSLECSLVGVFGRCRVQCPLFYLVSAAHPAAFVLLFFVLVWLLCASSSMSSSGAEPADAVWRVSVWLSCHGHT